MKKEKVQKAARFEDYLRKHLRTKEEKRAYAKERKAVFLAYKITTLREDLGMTQAELAHRMNTSQQAVSRLESGDYEGFTLKTLEKLADAMGVELVLDLRKKAKTA